ncbi:PREDICTED: RBBP8 N-terminal-like protein [Sturnus vulgaris]|uniref:RBBP8 N-terminal-like protein n=1 Tax=Sturnus vulgaris TaxID=9172 RepID=UPI00071A52BA|nr:PREDICTED: RBBP8 N-terminal-like protein [Sturnus vulgaris]
MTTESFAEFLNKLKEIHEKEVQGLHSKVTELTTEKCRDAQRIEELFAKNHQLREQQKVLKENVKVLENRLRAGLCDRCMVTQELAKKKQNEYETSHFQSLQHIFILSNETNRLREENKTLKEELKRLRSLEDRAKTPGVSSRESCSTPSSPLTLLSPVSRNVSTEKAEHKEAEEAHQDVPDLELSEEKPPEKLQRSSPSSRTSPGTVLQEVSLAEIASQRISNQLHGTIALVRPGSRPCLLEKSPSGAAVSPPARKTPLPPEREHSPSLEAYLTASKLDSPKVAPSYENLKLSARREQLCLLHKHLSLQQLGLAGPCAPAERDSLPSPLLRTKAAESRTRSRDSWEEHAALLKLPATMVYVRDQHLEEKLQLLKHRERLQHLLLQQCQPGQRAHGDTKPPPGERPLSPWLGIAAACKEERFLLEDAADGKGEKELWLGRERCELRAKVKEARDDDADAPLDLSEPGRGRDTDRHGRRDSPGDSPAVAAARGGHRAQRDDLRCPYHWPSATRPLPGAAKEEEEEEEEDAAVLTLSRAYLTNNSTPSDPEALPEAGMRRDVSAQKGEADDNDAESGKQESDEPDTTDSEEKYEDEILQEAEADGKYFCTKDKVHVQQRKRKRGQDPWIKGSKKSMRGKKKIKVEQCPVGITKELENCSASHSDPSKES